MVGRIIQVGLHQRAGDKDLNSSLQTLTKGRWFALIRQWTPWLAPRHGSNVSFELDGDAVICSFLSPEGKHMVFLGISGHDNVMTLFRSGDAGRLMVHV